MRSRPRLNPEITNGIKNIKGLTGLADVYTPNRNFKRAVVAGYLLRRESLDDTSPPLELADDYLPIGRFTSPSAALFRRIVNSSLDRKNAEQGFSHRKSSVYEHTCEEAEFAFGRSIGILRRQLSSGLHPHGNRIIGSATDPLLLQKTEGAKTALSLRQLVIGGVEYPAGSIMGVHVRRDRQPSDGKYHPQVAYGTVDTLPATEIENLVFIRPSMFAFSPKDRAVLANHYANMNRAVDDRDIIIGNIVRTAIEEVAETAAQYFDNEA